MNKVKLLIRMLGLTQVQVRPKHQVRSDINVLIIEGLVYQISLWELAISSGSNWSKMLRHGNNYSYGFKPDLFILDDLQQMTNIKGSF